MNNISVTILRGTRGEQHKTEYTVPFSHGMSVMNLLDYIYENIDPTLSYFSHEACRQAACGKCAVKVNGKTALACACPVTGEALYIEPVSDRVVRDLMCE